VAAVRFQAAKVRDALIEVRDSTADSVIKVEAQSLAEEVGSYRFCICTVVWYDILVKVQNVNKLLQSPTMHLDVAVDLLKKAEVSLASYRSTGFADAQSSAKELCEEMNVVAALQQKRLRVTKRQFSYEAPDEELGDALKRMEVSFFNAVVIRVCAARLAPSKLLSADPELSALLPAPQSLLFHFACLIKACYVIT